VAGGRRCRVRQRCTAGTAERAVKSGGFDEDILLEGLRCKRIRAEDIVRAASDAYLGGMRTMKEEDRDISSLVVWKKRGGRRRRSEDIPLEGSCCQRRRVDGIARAGSDACSGGMWVRADEEGGIIILGR
jgi:hypothetical protein